MLHASDHPKSWVAADAIATAAVAAGIVSLGIAAQATVMTRVFGLCAGLALLFLVVQLPLSLSACIGLLAATFAGNWGLMGLPTTIAPERTILLIVAIRAALQLRKRRVPLPWSAWHWWAVVLCVYATLSATWVGTLFTKEGAVLLVDRLGLVPFLLCFLAPVIFRTRDDRSRLLAAVVILGLYLGVTAWAEMLHANVLVFPRYISDAAIGYQYGRARGPFIESVANGMALFQCGVLSCVALAVWKKGYARQTARICIALTASALPLTLTRSIWIGSGVAIIVGLITSHAVRGLALKYGALLIGVALPFLLIGGFAATLQARTSDQFPIWDRINTDAAAVRMIEVRPLLGFGWDTFDARNGPYFVQTGDTPLSSGVAATVHNVFLGTAAELGLLGLFLWALAAGGLFGRIAFHPARRMFSSEQSMWRTATLVLAAQWLVVANLAPLGYVLPNLLIWITCGVMWGMMPPPVEGDVGGVPTMRLPSFSGLRRRRLIGRSVIPVAARPPG